jgi:hypothetical protein
MTKGPALRSRRWTLAGVGVAIGGPPALAAVSPAVTGGTANLVLQVVLHLVFVAVAALVLFIMLRHERLSLSSVGLRRPDWSTLLTAGLLLVSALLLQALVIDPLAALWRQEGVDDGIRQLVALPLWFGFVVVVTSGVATLWLTCLPTALVSCSRCSRLVHRRPEASLSISTPRRWRAHRREEHDRLKPCPRNQPRRLGSGGAELPWGHRASAVWAAGAD